MMINLGIPRRDGQYIHINSSKYAHSEYLHHCSFVSTNIMKATYGHEVKSDEDKFLKLAFNAVSALTSNPAGGTDLVDILPFSVFP